LELSHFSGKRIDEVAPDALAGFADLVDPLRLFITKDDIAGALEAIEGDRDNDGEGGFGRDITSGRMKGAKMLVEAAKRTGAQFSRGEWCADGEGPQETPLVWESLARVEQAEDLVQRWRLFLLRKQIRGEAENGRDIASLGSAAVRLEADEIRDLLLDSVAGAFDPASEYQRPYRKVAFARNLSLAGTTTGVELRREDSGRVVVHESPEGGPAPGSEVLGVGQEGGELVGVGGLSDTRLEELSGGGGGDGTRLQVTGESGLPETVELDAVDDPENETYRAAAELVHLDGRVVGFLSIPLLYGWGGGDAGGDFRRLVERLVQSGAQAIALDLRGNSGGSVEEAREMAGVFLGSEMVALGQDRNGGVREFHGTGQRGFDGPVACLVDAETGSSAEILAGTLQHHRRAIILGGGDTRGKGTAQAVLDLAEHGFQGEVPDGHLGSIRVSTMLLYTPGGRAIQGRGVTPDITVPCGLEAARVAGEMRGTDEKPSGAGTLGGAGAGEASMDTQFARVAGKSRERVAANSFFLRTGKLVAKSAAVIRANSLKKGSPRDAGALRALHQAMAEGRTGSVEFLTEAVAGPDMGSRARRFFDPYEAEAIQVAYDLLGSTEPTEPTESTGLGKLSQGNDLSHSPQPSQPPETVGSLPAGGNRVVSPHGNH
jgi:carboxyl-terminal processing protease